MFGPARMPADVVQRLNADVVAIVNRPEMREQFARQAFAPATSTPGELAAHVKEQYEIWGKAIREAGIQPD
jgi:tripartite-type tricarboxylate transporter receptor subunit TctC